MPRSGSAWLSNFLTYGGSFCYHEPLVEIPPEELVGKLSSRPETVVGAVDTGAAFFKDRLPEIPTYALVRDETESRDSLWRLNLPWIPSYGRVVAMGVPVIEYRKMFDLGYLRDVWIMLTQLPFDEERAKLAIEMNVQRSISALIKRGEA